MQLLGVEVFFFLSLFLSGERGEEFDCILMWM